MIAAMSKKHKKVQLSFFNYKLNLLARNELQIIDVYVFYIGPFAATLLSNPVGVGD